MSDLTYREAFLSGGQLGPWTVCGGPDPDFDDIEREVHTALLTDSNLLTCFRRHFPTRGHMHYDEMVRLLDYVWDCPHDGTANVVGYRCGTCGSTRASTFGEVQARERGGKGTAPGRGPPVRQWSRPSSCVEIWPRISPPVFAVVWMLA